MSSSPKSPGLLGSQDERSAADPFSATDFIIRSVLAGIATATIVKVVAVTNSGGVEPVGTVDIQPLVMRINGDGQIFSHGTIHGVPYQRLQGGANAVILDPQVGDIGIAVFASRDISSVIATKAESQPGSRRMFSWGDAMYIGGILNGTPTQYVQFSAAGIVIHSPTKVTLDAPSVEISCQTLQIDASTAVTVNTPTFTVNGNSSFNGNTATSGNANVTGPLFANGPLLAAQNLAVSGVAAFSGGIFDGTRSIGAGHTHGGVQTGSGHTLAVD